MQQGYMPGRIEEFVRSHPGRGVLRVQVGTGRGTFPVKGALVRVSKVIGGAVQEFYRGFTDESGILDGMVLPTLPGGLSQNSVTAGESGTDYIVSVEQRDYVPENGRKVTVYDGVETLLAVSMVPQLQRRG